MSVFTWPVGASAAHPRQALAAVGLSIAFSAAVACSPAADTAKSSNTKSLNDGIAAALVSEHLNEQYFWTTSGPNERCNAYFEIVGIMVTDKMIEGRKAKVTADVEVRALRDVPTGLDANRCFGSVPNGWSTGQQAKSRKTIDLELWDSGWKPAPFTGPV